MVVEQIARNDVLTSRLAGIPKAYWHPEGLLASRRASRAIRDSSHLVDRQPAANDKPPVWQRVSWKQPPPKFPSAFPGTTPPAQFRPAFRELQSRKTGSKTAEGRVSQTIRACPIRLAGHNLDSLPTSVTGHCRQNYQLTARNHACHRITSA